MRYGIDNKSTTNVNLFLRRDLLSHISAIKLGEHVTFPLTYSYPHHNEKEQADDIRTPHNRVRPILLKEAGFKDLSIFKWFRERSKKNRLIKEQIKAKNIIKQQGKVNQTVKFTYINLSGKKSKKEVDPYEIKGPYLWAIDRANREHIKRFFIKKMKNVRPGVNTFEPLWEVKLAMEKTGNILRSPAILRATERAIGAGLGGAIGLGVSAGEPKSERVVKTLQGAGAGFTVSMIGSGLIRKGILRKAMKRRQTKKWIMKKYDISGKKKLYKKYPEHLKEVRRELDIINDPAKFRKYVKDWEVTLGLEEFEKSQGLIKKLFPQIRTRGQRTAFMGGMLRHPKPRLMNASMAEARALGQTVRGNFFNPETLAKLEKGTIAKVQERIGKVQEWVSYDSQRYLKRVGKMSDRKLFRTI